ncbi:MAG: DNA polymerase III subunit delta [Verrucomicrobia bacterium]|nr:DNA polymerase III subunit delta [Verrucomicrobiota bacterium]MCF7708145.1 DNA polymerase III subunit delta [Verrucomicrobiota bacterium]
MVSKANKASEPRQMSILSEQVVFIHGSDSLTVGRRARALFDELVSEHGDFDAEVIDAAAGNSDEAVRALNRLDNALESLPLFSDKKVVWFKNCNFLGNEKTASGKNVTERLNELAGTWENIVWDKLKLLVSAGKINKQRVFCKILLKSAATENYEVWSASDRDWQEKAEDWLKEWFHATGKSIDTAALSKLVMSVGPDPHRLYQEHMKVCLYAGERDRIKVEDIDAIVTSQQQAEAFALAETFGNRDLPGVLANLEKEFSEIRAGGKKNEITVLYGLIAKVRAMLFVSILLREGVVQPRMSYPAFKAQLEQAPRDIFPDNEQCSPFSMNPYVLYKAAGQVRNFSESELVNAMEVLLDCNKNLVFSMMDKTLLLQQALIQIVGMR